MKTGKHVMPGFTLVEMMVVVATIGIVAALMLTAISQAKSRVLRIKCTNNVRQLGLALQEFRTDHHYYPPDFDPSLHDENRNWKSTLGNEMGSEHNHDYIPIGVWHCPSAFRPAGIPTHVGYDDYGYNVIGLGRWSYTNSLGLSDYWADGPNQPTRPAHRVTESDVASPSEMLAIGDAFFGSRSIIHDGDFFGSASDIAVSGSVFSGDSSVESTKRCRNRHQGNANVVFCDGHVESLTLKYLFADSNDDVLSYWNRDHQPHRERLLQ